MYTSAVPISVYPRVCGGTPKGEEPLIHRVGLSPRVRGNPGAAGANRQRLGSIPACAGEPGARTPPLLHLGVYPRVCGGTPEPVSWTPGEKGLSPRVRGNRCARRRQDQRGRSIPACAGEPGQAALNTDAPEVYPRVCGGTVQSARPNSRTGGLSPRVRGNLGSASRSSGRQRSIPACAGEPGARAWAAKSARVYPRVCGGTLAAIVVALLACGLSPRVRGNPGRHIHRRHRPRSIPACAGEPATSSRPKTSSKVYPRVCGGTPQSRQVQRYRSGLSPRVRGNQGSNSQRCPASGSIPACAGEP